jgi:hypothetical protein
MDPSSFFIVAPPLNARTFPLCRSSVAVNLPRGRSPATDGLVYAGLLGGAQRGLELGLVLMRERRFQNLASRSLQLLEHPFRRDLPDQDEQRRALDLKYFWL